MQTCTKCGETKEYTAFSFDIRYKTAHSTICKQCHREYAKKHREANRDKWNAQRRARRAKKRQEALNEQQ